MTSSWNYGTTPVFVSDGQTVRFRYKAPDAWDSSTTVTVKIGLQTTTWYISTLPQEFAPSGSPPALPALSEALFPLSLIHI